MLPTHGERRLLKTLFALLFLVVTAGLGHAAEQLVVIAASLDDTRHKTGAILTTDAELTLGDGETLTLLTESGTVVRLTGPHGGPIFKADSAGNAGNGIARIARFVAGTDGATSVLGASRDPDGREGIAEQPDIWFVNTDSSGERCVLPTRLELWRKNSKTTSSVTVRGEREKLPKEAWPEGVHVLVLPSRLAQDGDRLVLSVDGKNRRYTLHVLPDVIKAERWGEVLQWMIANDCKRQATLLIGALHTGQLIAR